MPCPKCGEKLNQGSWHISDRGMGNSKGSMKEYRGNDGLQPFIQINVVFHAITMNVIMKV